MNHELSTLLITQLWQVTLLAVVVWIAVRFVAKNRPHLAHALWLLVLLKCITPPVWSSPVSPFSWLQAKPSIAELPSDALLTAAGEEADATTRPVDDTIVVNVDRSQSTKTRELASMEAAVLPGDSSIQQRSVRATKPGFSWTTGLLMIWLGGAVIGLTVALARIAWFLHWTRERRVETGSELKQTVAALCCRLGIRRRVRVHVIDRPVGPAVLGLFRPTILLPYSIVDSSEQSKLETMLAHELVHIRRGDLWWALVQTLAGCLFWFHPLVRLSVHMVTRESERSCDEETVASLGCSPAAYARSLLEILEQKQRLRVSPALPGIRPVDITSARLERVMKLGNGSHRRTPLWVWMVMLISGAIVLPGAALVFGQGERIPVVQSQPQGNSQPVTDRSRWWLESHDVSDLLAEIDKTGNTDLKPSAKLIRMLPCRFPQMAGKSCTPLGRNIEFLAMENGKRRPVKLGNTEPTMKVVDGTLYVYGTDAEHEKVEATLKHVRERGYRQVVVEVRFVTGDPQAWADLGFDWQFNDPENGNAKISAVQTVGAVTTMPESFDAAKHVKPEFAESARATSFIASEVKQGYPFFPDINQVTQVTPVDKSQANDPARAATGLQRQLTAKYTVITSAQMKEVIDRSKGDTRINITQAPTVSMYDGQSAMVKDASSRPFVIGVKPITNEDATQVAYQPKIGVVEDGITVKVQPEIQSDGTVQLNGQLMISEITEVQQYSFKLDQDQDQEQENGEPRELTIQVPVIAVHGVRANANVPDGDLVAISTQLPSIGEDKKPRTMLVLLRCAVVNEPPNFVQTVMTRPSRTGVSPIDSGPARLLPIVNNGPEFHVTARQLPADSPDSNESPSPSNNSEILIIRSLDESDAPEFEPIVQTLEGLDISLQLETDVEMQMIADGLQIRGNNLSIFSKDNCFSLQGKQGVLEFKRNNNFAMKFSGNAKLKWDEDFRVSADSLEQWLDNDRVKLILEGNVKMVSSEYELFADRIVLEDEIVVLEGDARLKRSLKDGSEMETSGEKIRLNFDTNELRGETDSEEDKADSGQELLGGVLPSR